MNLGSTFPGMVDIGDSNMLFGMCDENDEPWTSTMHYSEQKMTSCEYCVEKTPISKVPLSGGFDFTFDPTEHDQDVNDDVDNLQKMEALDTYVN